ncbi:MAG: methyltransferase domain-containing protein [Lapillicoccus sp.]
MALGPVARRRDRLFALVDVTSGAGLEIGPLDSPLVLADEANVRYADVLDQEGLRRHFTGDANVVLDEIPPIDFVLTGPEGARLLGESVPERAAFDWVVASHVVEHVPDLLGWLDDIASLCADGGQLALVVPDRRYTFDIHRAQTTIGQIIETHELGPRVPTTRAVFDHFASHATVPVDAAWRGEMPSDAARTFSLEQVSTVLDQARNGEYVDSHVWTFTPSTFADQMVMLGRLGLVHLVPEAVTETGHDDLEFYAVLRRLPRTSTAAEVAAAWEDAELALAPLLPAYRGTGRPEVAALEGRRRELESDLATAVQRETELVRRVADLESALAGMRGSRRWRIGGAVARPVNAVRRARSSWSRRVGSRLSRMPSDAAAPIDPR